MPTYQYRCTECSNELEVVQSFTDDPLTVCPTCSGTLRKVYGSVGVVFKGPGFYATDNRSAGRSSTPDTGSSAKPADTAASTPASSKTTSDKA
jgi:putative FmdB family regulatory protein